MVTKPNNENLLSEEIAKKEQLKLKAIRDKNGVWFGLGMMGMVGWSVAVPTLIGAAIGVWLDKSYPQTFSWTLSLLFVGLVTGVVIAGYWVQNEDKEIHKNDTDE